MIKIKEIKAREILDSRGNPTVEASVLLTNGTIAKSAAPSGVSIGRDEAVELRDGDQGRYRGLGVLKAVSNINTEISKALIGVNILNQEKIDKVMLDLDGTSDKRRLGANAILPVSLSCARAAASSKGQELFEYISKKYKFKNRKFTIPTPSFNIFNGGKYADTNLDFQEFMILPLTNISFAEKVRMGAEIFHELMYVLHDAGYDTDVGNEGGYAPNIHSSIQAIELIMAATIEAGYTPGVDIGLGIDVASSELYDVRTDKYIFKLDRASYLSSTLIGLYHEWLRKYPIVAIEDGLAGDNWEGWSHLNAELGEDMLIIGDDLFKTNISRLRKGLKKLAANAILIKPNQVGTLTETIECIQLAQRHNYKIIVSHRSGETSDAFIADLAVAVGADYIKAGSLSRSERLVKYNRLMEIEGYLISKHKLFVK